VQLFVLLLQNFEKVVQMIELKRFGGAPNGYPFAPLAEAFDTIEHGAIIEMMKALNLPNRRLQWINLIFSFGFSSINNLNARGGSGKVTPCHLYYLFLQQNTYNIWLIIPRRMDRCPCPYLMAPMIFQ
jgi:hypothetical protein